jgi:hypothetical protein
MDLMPVRSTVPRANTSRKFAWEKKTRPTSFDAGAFFVTSVYLEVRKIGLYPIFTVLPESDVLVPVKSVCLL